MTKKPVSKWTTISPADMVDVVKSSWGYIVTDIAMGRDPEPRHLERALLSNAPPPREVIIYLAGMVAGKKRPAHRPKDPFTEFHLVNFAKEVDRLTAICRAGGGKGPQKMVLEFMSCQDDGLPTLGAARARYAAGKRLREEKLQAAKLRAAKKIK